MNLKPVKKELDFVQSGGNQARNHTAMDIKLQEFTMNDANQVAITVFNHLEAPFAYGSPNAEHSNVERIVGQLFAPEKRQKWRKYKGKIPFLASNLGFGERQGSMDIQNMGYRETTLTWSDIYLSLEYLSRDSQATLDKLGKDKKIDKGDKLKNQITLIQRMCEAAKKEIEKEWNEKLQELKKKSKKWKERAFENQKEAHATDRFISNNNAKNEGGCDIMDDDDDDDIAIVHTKESKRAPCDTLLRKNDNNYTQIKVANAGKGNRPPHSRGQDMQQLACHSGIIVSKRERQKNIHEKMKLSQTTFQSSKGRIDNHRTKSINALDFSDVVHEKNRGTSPHESTPENVYGKRWSDLRSSIAADDNNTFYEQKRNERSAYTRRQTRTTRDTHEIMNVFAKKDAKPDRSFFNRGNGNEMRKTGNYASDNFVPGQRSLRSRAKDSDTDTAKDSFRKIQNNADSFGDEDNPVCLLSDQENEDDENNGGEEAVVATVFHANPTSSKDLSPSNQARLSLRRSTRQNPQVNTNSINNSISRALRARKFTYPRRGDIDGVEITQEEFRRLENGSEFLNDSIIDAQIKHIISTIPPSRKADLQDDFHVFNTFFFQKMTKNAHTAGDRHKNVKKWTKTVDIFSKKFVFFPICDHTHWSLIVLCNPGHPICDENNNDNHNDNDDDPSGTGFGGVRHTHGRKNRRAKMILDASANASQGSHQRQLKMTSFCDATPATSEYSAEKDDIIMDAPVEGPFLLHYDSLPRGHRTSDYTSVIKEYLSMEWLEKKKNDPDSTPAKVNVQSTKDVGGRRRATGRRNGIANERDAADDMEDGSDEQVVRGEADDKQQSKIGDRDFSCIKSMKVAAPRQSNGCDCGLFLLKYLQLFLFEAPVPLSLSRYSSVSKLKEPFTIFGPKWFLPEEASQMRIEIITNFLENLRGQMQQHQREIDNNANNNDSDNNCNNSNTKSSSYGHTMYNEDVLRSQVDSFIEDCKQTQKENQEKNESTREKMRTDWHKRNIARLNNMNKIQTTPIRESPRRVRHLNENVRTCTNTNIRTKKVFSNGNDDDIPTCNDNDVADRKVHSTGGLLNHKRSRFDDHDDDFSPARPSWLAEHKKKMKRAHDTTAPDLDEIGNGDWYGTNRERLKRNKSGVFEADDDNRSIRRVLHMEGNDNQQHNNVFAKYSRGASGVISRGIATNKFKKTFEGNLRKLDDD